MAEFHCTEGQEPTKYEIARCGLQSRNDARKETQFQLSNHSEPTNVPETSHATTATLCNELIDLAESHTSVADNFEVKSSIVPTPHQAKGLVYTKCFCTIIAIVVFPISTRKMISRHWKTYILLSSKIYKSALLCAV